MKAMIAQRFILFGLLSLSLSACSGGGSSLLQNAKLDAYIQNGEDYARLSAQINDGGLLLPAVIPIMHPRNPAVAIGEVALRQDLSGSFSELSVALNLTQTFSLPERQRGVLPNGLSIPLAGINEQNWIVIPIASSGSRVYLNVDVTNRKAALGAAITIPALSTPAPAVALLPFKFQDLRGLAGLYTGLPQQSGFALFADASALFGGTSTLSFLKQEKSVQSVEKRMFEVQSKGIRLKMQ